MCMIVVCVIERATSIKKLMCDLPLARLAAHKKPFIYSRLDYLCPLNFAEGKSNKKAWGLLSTCMSSRAIYAELVTSLPMDDILLTFT